MVLEVLTYPNKILYEKSKEVTKFDAEFGKFLDDMYETMIAKSGIGLAAIQVGKPIQALVINLADEEGIQNKANLLEIINPKIIKANGEQIYQEGCLSVPGFYEDVKRAENIVLKYQNRNGESCELKADGLLAVCIQHEIDHLNGHLFIERIGYNKRKKFNQEFKKKQKEK